MAKLGVATKLDLVELDLQRRDRLDSEREYSPLTRARDAVLVDTSKTTVEGQVEKILGLLKAAVS
jgi:cytidylate kinase